MQDLRLGINTARLKKLNRGLRMRKINIKGITQKIKKNPKLLIFSLSISIILVAQYFYNSVAPVYRCGVFE